MPKYKYNVRAERIFKDKDIYEVSDCDEAEARMIKKMKMDRSGKEKKMRLLKEEKGESVIPSGIYCYDGENQCPYLDIFPDYPVQESGYCWFMKRGDWEVEGLSLLWDSCKECGIKEDLEKYFGPGKEQPKSPEQTTDN